MAYNKALERPQISGATTVNPVRAQIVGFQVPNIPKAPQSAAGDLADALGSINKKLADYQKSNAQAWRTEADLNAENLINKKLAEGQTYEQIMSDFQSEKYPELKTQMQYDSFNYAFGGRAWNSFAATEGKKLTDQILNNVKNSPFEDVDDINIDADLATVVTKFQGMYGNKNYKMQAGAFESIQKWRHGVREEFNKAYNLRLTTEKVNTGVANGIAFMADTLNFQKTQIEIQELDPADDSVIGTEVKGRTSQKVVDHVFNNVSLSLNEFLRTYQNNVGLGSSSIKTMRLNILEGLMSQVQTGVYNEQDSLAYVKAIRKIITESPEQGIPSPLLDSSATYKPDGSKGSQVKARAEAVMKDVATFESAYQEKRAISHVAYLINNKIPVPERHRKYIDQAGDLITNNLLAKYKDNPVEFKSALADAAERHPAQLNYLVDKIRYHSANLKDRMSSKDSDIQNALVADVENLYQWYSALSGRAKDLYFKPRSYNRTLMDNYSVLRSTKFGDKPEVHAQGGEAKGILRAIQTMQQLTQTADGSFRTGKRFTDKQVKKIFDGLDFTDVRKVDLSTYKGVKAIGDTDMTKAAKFAMSAEIEMLARVLNHEGIPESAVIAHIKKHLRHNYVGVGDRIVRVGHASPFRNPAYATAAADNLDEVLDAIAKDQDMKSSDITLVPVNTGNLGTSNEYMVVTQDHFPRVLDDTPIVTFSTQGVANWFYKSRAESN
jgi:hypothetical protein